MTVHPLQLVGGMTISAIPDMAKVVFSHGLTSTFKDGFIPLVRNFAVAEQERAMISQRTKDALAAVKARGVKLGNPQIRKAQEAAAERRTAIADGFASNVLPIIREIQATGASMRKTAAALNARGIPTARGGTWAATQISDILKRSVV
jgi:hypothetical protein